jgi:excisionase family DNA binding protein
MLLYEHKKYCQEEGIMAVKQTKRPRINNERIMSGDVAIYCQVSKSTVLEWIKSNRLKAFRLPSGHYRIDRKDFKDFLTRWSMPIKGWPFEACTTGG